MSGHYIRMIMIIVPVVHPTGISFEKGLCLLFSPTMKLNIRPWGLQLFFALSSVIHPEHFKSFKLTPARFYTGILSDNSLEKNRIIICINLLYLDDPENSFLPRCSCLHISFVKNMHIYFNPSIQAHTHTQSSK